MLQVIINEKDKEIFARERYEHSGIFFIAPQKKN